MHAADEVAIASASPICGVGERHVSSIEFEPVTLENLDSDTMQRK